MTTTTCRVVDHDGHQCGADTNGFVCKACLAKLRRALAGGDQTPSVTSLAHELSVLATRQTNVYRANGRAVPDEELADLEEEYAWRRALIPPHLRTREGRVTLPTSELMVNEQASNLLAELTNTVTTWARAMAEGRGTLVNASNLAETVEWLVDNLEAVRFDEYGPHMIEQILDVHHRAMNAVDRRSNRVFVGLCHAKLPSGGTCTRELYAYPGADVVECDGWRPWEPGQQLEPGCGHRHTQSERDAWMFEQFLSWNHTINEGMTLAPRFLPPDQALPARSVLNAAGRTSRMPIKGTNANGDPLFSGRDLLAVITAWRPRAYAPRPNHHKRRTA